MLHATFFECKVTKLKSSHNVACDYAISVLSI